MKLKSVGFGNATVENGEVNIVMTFSVADQDCPEDENGNKNLADVLEVAGSGESCWVEIEADIPRSPGHD